MPNSPDNRQKFVGDRVALPFSFGLALIVVLAVFIAMIFTGNLSHQEAELMKKKTLLKEKMK